MYSLFASHLRPITFSMPPLLVLRNFVMPSKSGEFDIIISRNVKLRSSTRHLHESQNFGAGAGGRTPYGAGSRTPARTPGHMTPGRLSVRQHARTPNAYGAMGGATPSRNPTTPGYVPQTPYNYGTPYPGHAPNTPQQPPPMQIPPGMNPARAAMIQSSGGWSQSGGQW